MKTRTVEKQPDSLEHRIIMRNLNAKRGLVLNRDHIRAELDRLAGKVRGHKRELVALLHPGERDALVEGRIHGLNDVLALIKEAKR